MRDHATVFDCFRIVVVGLCKFDVIEWGLKAPVPLLKDLRPNKQCLLVDQNMSQTIYFYSRKLFIYVTNIEKWPAFRLKIHIEKLMVSKNSASQSTSCSKLANRIMKTCFFHPTCSLQVGGSRSEDLQIETNSKEELRKDDRRSTGITWWQLKRFLCSPRSLGEKDPIWREYFSDGLKPPKPS